jgi:hypothetical protein
MKRRNWSLMMLIGWVLAFSSCQKSNTAVPVTQIPTTNISLKFSGGFYSSTSAVAVYSKSANAIQIGGVFGSNSYVNLLVPNVSVGTFDLSGGNASLSFLDGNKNPDSFVSTSGSVVITEFNSTSIVGTFQFTGVDSSKVSRQITEGQFTTGYTVTP